MPLAVSGAVAGVRGAVSATGVAEGCMVVEPGSAFADVRPETAGVGTDDCEAEPDAVRATPTDVDAPAGVDEAGAEPAAPADDGAATGCATGAHGRAIASVAARATPIGDDPSLDADAVGCGSEPNVAAAVPTGEVVVATDAADAGTCAAEPVEDVAASTDEGVAAMAAVFAADTGVAEPAADTVEPTDDETVAATGTLFAAEAASVEPDAASAGDAAAAAAVVAAANGRATADFGVDATAVAPEAGCTPSRADAGDDPASATGFVTTLPAAAGSMACAAGSAATGVDASEAASRTTLADVSPIDEAGRGDDSASDEPSADAPNAAAA
ncbi:hypothetical protein FEQ05_06782 [Burkholderia pseudomultivorans]|uniref:hypothetical protein n=1 Tax=Burkholderia pseudomultivorans TaxID=1207504 RepID=UPI002855A53C|nr:hypothetical protein [Burkholderia pseudomultivorans]MDR8823030.1 hypothetical protein [Burkholderia pseudomultivorans]MDR8849507.1 hypothetical protein [Burkholderia pseudomultivorans]